MRMRTPKIAGLAVASVLLLAACSSGGDTTDEATEEPTGGGTVTYAGYGGAGEEAERAAWFDPFTEETGTEVLNDSPADWTRLQEMVNAGNVTWDIIQIGLIDNLVDSPYLEQIDCDIVDCAAFDDAAFPAFPQAIPLFTFSQVVAYNTEAFPEGSEPDGFPDFFDPEVKGPRMMPGTGGGWQGILEAALLYDGVSRDDLYPIDVDRALSVIEGIRDQLIIYTDTGQCVSSVASGEGIMGICFNGRVGAAMQEGQPVAIAWGQQGQLADYLMIPKGAPDLDNAQRLIAHIVDNQGRISDYIAYGGINPNSPAEESEWTEYVPTSNELEGDLAPIAVDQEWWLENFETVVTQLTTWLQS